MDSYFEDVGGLGLRLAILAFGLAFHEEIEVGGDDSVEPGFVEGDVVDGFVVLEVGVGVAYGVFDFQDFVGKDAAG